MTRTLSLAEAALRPSTPEILIFLLYALGIVAVLAICAWLLLRRR